MENKVPRGVLVLSEPGRVASLSLVDSGWEMHAQREEGKRDWQLFLDLLKTTQLSPPACGPALTPPRRSGVKVGSPGRARPPSPH